MAIEDYLFLGRVCRGAKAQCHKVTEYVSHRDDKLMAQLTEEQSACPVLLSLSEEDHLAQ
jgi:hypothetical protein